MKNVKSRATKRGIKPRRASDGEKLSTILGLGLFDRDKISNNGNSSKNYLTVNEIVEKTVAEINESNQTKNYSAVGSLKLSPEEGYTKAISFTSQDHSESRTFYFKEDEEPPECVKFNLGTGVISLAEAEKGQIEEFYNTHWAAPDNSELLQAYFSDLKFVIKQNNSIFLKMLRAIESTFLDKIAEQVILSEGISSSSLDFKEYKYTYIRSLHTVKSPERVIKKILKKLLKGPNTWTRSEITSGWSLDRIIRPLIFYIYPKEDEDNANLTSWPLFFQRA